MERMIKSTFNILILIISLLLTVTLLGCVSTDVAIQRVERDIQFNNPNRTSISVPFELINNLVVIPLRINNSDTLHFILDTGVRQTIITELDPGSEFEINYDEEIEIVGLGDSEPIAALLSRNNEIRLKGIRGKNHDVVVLLDGSFNLSKFMGKTVNGLIGYDFFENFIVELDYRSKKLFFHDPDFFKAKYSKLKKDRKWSEIPVTILERKPYITAEIKGEDGTFFEVQLLVDSGASHTFFLFPTSNDRIEISNKSISSFLGTGLNGELYGKIARVDEVKISDLTITRPVVAYPNEEGIQAALRTEDRHGSIGSELLRRFKVYFNYLDGSMLVRPNRWFNQSFNYNMSGMEISTPYANLPYYVVSKVREGSPADLAGVKRLDVLYKINYKKIYDYDLNAINSLLQKEDGKKINLIVYRNGSYKTINFRLKDETW